MRSVLAFEVMFMEFVEVVKIGSAWGCALGALAFLSGLAVATIIDFFRTI